MRWSEDDGHVSVFRYPSNNSNGNTFDFQTARPRKRRGERRPATAGVIRPYRVAAE